MHNTVGYIFPKYVALKEIPAHGVETNIGILKCLPPDLGPLYPYLKKFKSRKYAHFQLY